VGGLNIAMGCKVSDQFVVGKAAGLGEPVHACWRYLLLR